MQIKTHHLTSQPVNQSISRPVGPSLLLFPTFKSCPRASASIGLSLTETGRASPENACTLKSVRKCVCSYSRAAGAGTRERGRVRAAFPSERVSSDGAVFRAQSGGIKMSVRLCASEGSVVLRSSEKLQVTPTPFTSTPPPSLSSSTSHAAFTFNRQQVTTVRRQNYRDVADFLRLQTPSHFVEWTIFLRRAC